MNSNIKLTNSMISMNHNIFNIIRISVFHLPILYAHIHFTI